MWSIVRGRLPVAALATLCCVATERSLALEDTPADCLFSDPQQRTPSAGCAADPLHLAGQTHIRAAMQAFQLTTGEIDLVGCSTAGFSSAQISGAVARRYRITYPILKDAELREYVGPLTHELAHVYQMERAGGRQQLRQQLGGSSERIELGADFLTGFVFRQSLTTGDRAAFQHNLNLLGSYRADDPRRYGAPEDRIAAFRSGYYYRTPERGLAAAYTTFQADIFGSLRVYSPTL